jgi:hypothetical protein
MICPTHGLNFIDSQSVSHFGVSMKGNIVDDLPIPQREQLHETKRRL